MDITIREEAGYNMALYGFSLSYKDSEIDPRAWWELPCEGCKNYPGCFSCTYNGITGEDDIELRMERIERAAIANCGRGKGHDKWIRQVMLWIDVNAPLSWWKHFDTYKVGTVAQSESTMHTLHRRDMVVGDVEDTVHPDVVEFFNAFKNGIKRTTDELNDNLPLGYKQRRVVTLNYAVLRCILSQREFHKLGHWKVFIDSIYNQVKHPELLPKRRD